MNPIEAPNCSSYDGRVCHASGVFYEPTEPEEPEGYIKIEKVEFLQKYGKGELVTIEDEKKE